MCGTGLSPIAAAKVDGLVLKSSDNLAGKSRRYEVPSVQHKVHRRGLPGQMETCPAREGRRRHPSTCKKMRIQAVQVRERNIQGRRMRLSLAHSPCFGNMTSREDTSVIVFHRRRTSLQRTPVGGPIESGPINCGCPVELGGIYRTTGGKFSPILGLDVRAIHIMKCLSAP